MFAKAINDFAYLRNRMAKHIHSLRVLLVENDAVQRLILKELFALHCPSLKVVGEAESIDEARLFLKRQRVDVLFLDILLHDQTAFDLLSNIKSGDYLTVFATAHSSFAVDSINKAGAVGYLVKPFNKNDLVEIEKRLLQLSESSKGFMQKLVIKHTTGQQRVALTDIAYLKAEGSYTTVSTQSGDKLTTSRNIRQFETQLNDAFLRVHRSYIVNLNHVTALRTQDSMAMMSNRDSIPVSRRLFKMLKARLAEM
jgi:two-component system, LytTR family, response regulator